MNATSLENNLAYSEYGNIGLGALLLISEIMPFIKGKSGGITDGLLCLLKGSSCFLKKLTDSLEKQKEGEIESV